MTDGFNSSIPSAVVSNDAIAMMKFQSKAKSTGAAYLLWFFLGGFGAHRFYVGSIGIGFLVLISTIVGVFLLLPLVITGLVCLYDLFTLPSQVERYNSGLMAEISQGRG